MLQFCAGISLEEDVVLFALRKQNHLSRLGQVCSFSSLYGTTLPKAAKLYRPFPLTGSPTPL